MPPPPPPPPGGLPKAKPVAIGKLGGGNPGDGRAALLSSIQKGAKLKKTVTVDKSGPMIAGKVSGTDTPKGATSSPTRSVGSNNNNAQNTSPPGNRFGGGGGGPLNFQDELASRLGRRNNNTSSDRPTEISQKSSPIAELKFKQSNGRLPNSASNGSLSNEPIANQSSLFNNNNNNNNNTNSNNNNNNNTARSQNFNKSKATLEGLFGGPPVPSSNSSNIGASNLQSQPLPQPPQPVQSTPKPHSYNKPNLAPKPPGPVISNTVNQQMPSIPVNPVTRHQSMRTPKSPPAAQPPFNPQFTMENHMGTMRVNKPQKMTEAINSKPRPPNKPPPPPPPTRQTPHLAQQSNLNTVNARSQNAINEFGKSPQLQMRPVVSASDLNDSENQAPPAPPHRVCPAPPVNMRSHPQMMQSDSPPAPPKRGSSMSASKKIIDLESKFQFHNVTEFPQPKPFLNLTKTYPSRATLRQSNGGM
jgi:WAS/WASL-interacting protein